VKKEEYIEPDCPLELQVTITARSRAVHSGKSYFLQFGVSSSVSMVSKDIFGRIVERLPSEKPAEPRGRLDVFRVADPVR